jgi:cell shape-determining protein MreC
LTTEAGVIENLLEFLIEFELSYNSDWKNYSLSIELNQKIKELEEKAEQANSEIYNLKEELTRLREKLKA